MKLLLAAALLLPPAFAAQSLTERKAASAPSDTARIVIYDVRDLLEHGVRDFEPVQLGVVQPRRQDAVAEKRAATPPTAEELRELAARDLETVIRKHLPRKAEWREAELQFGRNNSLIAVLEPAQHEWLQQFLNAQRLFEGLIRIQARVFQVPPKQLAQLGIESSAMLPSAADRDALLEKLAALPNTTAISAPALLAHPNQRANIAVVNQIAFVQSYTIEVVEPGRQEIADPQVAVINEGLVLDLRATPLDGQLLALDLALDCAEVVRPIKTRKVRPSTSAQTEVEIGVPEVLSSRIVSTVLVKEGASVVLSVPRRDQEQDLLLVVTAERVPNPVSTPEAK